MPSLKRERRYSSRVLCMHGLSDRSMYTLGRDLFLCFSFPLFFPVSTINILLLTNIERLLHNRADQYSNQYLRTFGEGQYLRDSRSGCFLSAAIARPWNQLFLWNTENIPCDEDCAFTSIALVQFSLLSFAKYVGWAFFLIFFKKYFLNKGSERENEQSFSTV